MGGTNICRDRGKGMITRFGSDFILCMEGDTDP